MRSTVSVIALPRLSGRLRIQVTNLDAATVRRRSCCGNFNASVGKRCVGASALRSLSVRIVAAAPRAQAHRQRSRAARSE
jgi:hypothetical protein